MQRAYLLSPADAGARMQHLGAGCNRYREGNFANRLAGMCRGGEYARQHGTCGGCLDEQQPLRGGRERHCLERHRGVRGGGQTV